MKTKNKPYDNFIIITKKPSYTFYSARPTNERVRELKKEFTEEKDKTFWIFEKDGTFVGRYSVESAPQWIMRVYRMLVG